MKSRLFVLLVSFITALALTGCGDKANKDDEGWKVAYSLGFRLGERIKKEIDDLNSEGFMAGFREGYAGGKDRKLTDEEMEAILKAYQEKAIAKKREEFQKKSEKNLADAKAFLETNGRQEGVVTLPSGLQYKVISQGEGPSPKATDIVKARYHGTLPDGTVFDSTRDRGDQPAEFPLNRVIPAWTEGLQLMNKGAKFMLFVPPELGYGERGAGEKIGPNQTLVFEVELVEFHDPANPPAP